MLWFALYSLVFIVLAWLEHRRGQTTEDYFLNRRRSSAQQTGFSIVASVVGGSATVGMCGLAYAVGTPALWWLLSGAAGLVLLRLFMVSRIREHTRALTMPGLVAPYIGRGATRLSCAVILCAWTTILAAQFLAMGRILEGLTGLSIMSATLAGAFVIVLYTWLGGQASVIKSDVLQLAVITAGLAAILGALAFARPDPLLEARLEWLNADFTTSDWGRFMLLIGGSYIVCPMLFSRVMSARDDASARRGTTIGIAGIIVLACLITALGLEARAWIPADTPQDAVLSTLVQQLPDWAGAAFFLVMASAILSSADSCLITAATIAASDVFKRPEVGTSRKLLLVISAAALALAFCGKSVLGLLLTANTIYTCAVVAPIFTALATRRRLSSSITLATIAAASVLALASELTSNETLTYVAAAVSIAGSMLAAVGQPRCIVARGFGR